MVFCYSSLDGLRQSVQVLLKCLVYNLTGTTRDSTRLHASASTAGASKSIAGIVNAGSGLVPG